LYALDARAPLPFRLFKTTVDGPSPGPCAVGAKHAFTGVLASSSQPHGRRRYPERRRHASSLPAVRGIPAKFNAPYNPWIRPYSAGRAPNSNSTTHTRAVSLGSAVLRYDHYAGPSAVRSRPGWQCSFTLTRGLCAKAALKRRGRSGRGSPQHNGVKYREAPLLMGTTINNFVPEKCGHELRCSQRVRAGRCSRPLSVYQYHSFPPDRPSDRLQAIHYEVDETPAPRFRTAYRGGDGVRFAPVYQTVTGLWEPKRFHHTFDHVGRCPGFTNSGSI